MFNVEREFPIIALFNEINKRFAEKFHQRYMEFINSPTIFVPSMEKKSKFVNLRNKLLTHQTTNYKFSISDPGEVATVDLQGRSCPNRVFDLTKYLVHMLWQCFGSNMVKTLEGEFMSTRLHIIRWTDT